MVHYDTLEAGVVIVNYEPVYWHVPDDRSLSYLPDSQLLWDILWFNREEKILGFAHTHPGYGVPGPSNEDLTTFSGIELGLGRRLKWWIANVDHVIELCWSGPNKYDYNLWIVNEYPAWIHMLRSVSNI